MCAYDQFILIESGFEPLPKRRPPGHVQIFRHNLVHDYLVPNRTAGLFFPETGGWCSGICGEAAETLRQFCHELVERPAIEWTPLAILYRQE